MAQPIPNITVTSLEWVDINTESGVTVGTKMEITNKSVAWCSLIEATTSPALSSKDGSLLTDLRNSKPIATIPSGSLKIWALCSRSGSTCTINVQEI